MRKGHKVAVYNGCSYWMDIGTPEKYLQTHEDIMSGDCRLSGVRFNGLGVVKGRQSVIDITAVISGPVYIGDNVKIGAYAKVGPNVVIGDDVRIHAGGSVSNSILWNNVDIGSLAEMDGIVAASDFKVQCETIPHNNALTSKINIKSGGIVMGKELMLGARL